MIKYNLICECGKTFESWFSNSYEYDLLKKKGIINCIYCDSNSVKKTIMSPHLSGKSNKTSKTNKLEKNCKDVGGNFAKEARSIHYDKKSSKGIYGKATPEETSELLEEGIDVTTVPWVKKSEN